MWLFEVVVFQGTLLNLFAGSFLHHRSQGPQSLNTCWPVNSAGQLGVSGQEHCGKKKNVFCDVKATAPCKQPNRHRNDPLWHSSARNTNLEGWFYRCPPSTHASTWEPTGRPQTCCLLLFPSPGSFQLLQSFSREVHLKDHAHISYRRLASISSTTTEVPSKLPVAMATKQPGILQQASFWEAALFGFHAHGVRTDLRVPRRPLASAWAARGTSSSGTGGSQGPREPCVRGFRPGAS